MGIDCCFILEQRKEGRWQQLTPTETDFQKIEDRLGNRDYALYAILAGDVRRRQERWCEPVVPVRGFPADSPKVGREAGKPDRHECHNATWMTIAELRDFPWHSRCTTIDVFLDGNGYLEYATTGEAPEIVHWQADRDVITEDEMHNRLNRGQRCSHLLAPVALDVSYKWYARPFLDHVMPVLLRLGPPEDVRLILWFSS